MAGLLLVSGWARRATFLWAVLPLLAIGIFEKITFNTSHFASMLKDRVIGIRYRTRFDFKAARHPTVDSASTAHSGKIPEHARSLDRTAYSRSPSSPPQSGCAVIADRCDQPAHQRTHKEKIHAPTQESRTHRRRNLSIDGRYRAIQLCCMFRANSSCAEISAATANNILAHETMFRLAILGDLFGSVIFICLGIALYRLLSSVNKTWAGLMVAFVLVSAAVGFLNTLNNVAALILFPRRRLPLCLRQTATNALGYLFLRLHSQGIFINELFWGLWLFPFGLLVFRSGFLPRFIGVWLMINCFGYVALSVIALFAPRLLRGRVSTGRSRSCLENWPSCSGF